MQTQFSNDLTKKGILSRTESGDDSNVPSGKWLAVEGTSGNLHDQIRPLLYICDPSSDTLGGGVSAYPNSLDWKSLRLNSAFDGLHAVYSMMPITPLRPYNSFSKSSKTPPIVAELKELLKDRAEWQEEGIEIEEASVNYAIEFANAVVIGKFPDPHIEVHSDGEVAFTWRKANRGIINIAFNKHGVATWAAYCDHKEKRTIKGRFNVEDSISKIEKTIIRFITD